MTVLDVGDVKDRHRRTWAVGNYPVIAAYQAPIADHLCSAAEVSSRDRVLDVATGTGNVALAAARRGAAVSALDLTPSMLEQARGRSREAGLHVDFVEGDAEDIPYPAGSFDVGLSACGLWFAPRPHLAVRELRRVVSPSGRIGLANFTPTGYLGRINELMKKYLPLPPGAPEPNDWAREDIAGSRLEECFEGIRFERSGLRWQFPSPRAATEFLWLNSPPHVIARDSLTPKWARELFSEIEAVTTDLAGGTGQVDIEAEYLVVLARAR